MSNFLQFIDEDIEAKKTLLSTMSTNGKRDIKKYNEKIDSIIEKYSEYKIRVKKYLDTKSKSFDIQINEKKLEDLKNKVSNLEHIRFVLNPTNTYFEKMGFDNLIFQISNYSDLDFKSLNEIINQFLNKFDLAGITLLNDAFDYTCYVHEYMTSFLDVRSKKSENYDEISKIFEGIYWTNPEIIEHIELNFRKLIRKHEKRFIDYITKLQKDIKLESGVINYEDCLEKLKTAYIELNVADKETLADIINLAKTGTIDINNYFENSKVRTSTYTSLMIEALDLNNNEIMEKFYGSLEKLKTNIQEYSDYAKFLPLIEDFKKEYQKQIPTGDKDSNKNSVNNLKTIQTQIVAEEAKLEKLNKKIFLHKPWFFESKTNDDSKQLKIDSIKQASALYELYKTFDQEYFKNKVQSILTSTLTTYELLHLYYSFDYFKKLAIKRVFATTNYDEVIKTSNDFDLFSMNPTNIITNSVPVFEENNIAKVIMNKYRLDNVNLTEESLNPEDLNVLLEKIQLLLRINEIQKSSTTVEKIWFMVQVEKINITENKSK